MNRMQFYIFWRAVKTFLLTLVVLIGVVWLTQALQQLDLLTNKGQTLLVFMQITWLVLPTFISFIAPVALLIAAIHVLNGLNNDSELVMMTNSGAAPFAVLKPLLFLALVVGIVDASIAHYFSPNAKRELRVFFTEVNSDLISTVIKPGEFASIDNGITFYVGARDNNGIFKDVFVADNREKTQSLVYLAKTGAITRTTEGTFFVLQNGTIHRRPEDRSSISIIDYSSYAFDLSTFEERVPNELRFKKPSENFTPYLTTIDEANSLFVQSPGRFFAEMHNRFSTPFYPFAFVLVAFFFLGRAQTTRQGRGLAIFASLLVAFLIRGLGASMQSLAEGLSFLMIAQYAVPLGASAVFLYLIGTHVEPRFLQNVPAQIFKLASLVRRLLPNIRPSSGGV